MSCLTRAGRRAWHEVVWHSTWAAVWPQDGHAEGKLGAKMVQLPAGCPWVLASPGLAGTGLPAPYVLGLH